MKTITQNCETCKNFFEAPLKEVKRGNGKYCSKLCSNEGVKKKQILRNSIKNQIISKISPKTNYLKLKTVENFKLQMRQKLDLMIEEVYLECLN